MLLIDNLFSVNEKFTILNNYNIFRQNYAKKDKESDVHHSCKKSPPYGKTVAALKGQYSKHLQICFPNVRLLLDFQKRQERYTSNAPIVALVQETIVMQKFQRANVHTSPFASKSKHCYVELITKQFAVRCKINEGETAGKMRLRVLLMYNRSSDNFKTHCTLIGNGHYLR